MQCPTCGREVEHLVQGSCAQCTSEKLVLFEMPEHVDVTVCAHCGRMQTGGTWRTLSPDRDTRTEELLRDVLSLDPLVRAPHYVFESDWEDDRNTAVHITVTGNIEKIPIERSADTRVRIKNGACPDCSREMGGYFEATIQVRGSPGTDLERILPIVEDAVVRRLEAYREEGRPNSFIQKLEKMRHGHDYVMGSKEAARLIATELAEAWGAELDESTKLVGRRDGRDLYRWTHLVRLPPYARGDFLLIDETPFKLLHFDRKHLQMLDLVRQVKIRRDLSRLSFKIIGRVKDQLDAVVISRSGRHVQVLDPVTFKTLDIPAASVPKEAQTVPVFRWEETLYPVVEAGA